MKITDKMLSAGEEAVIRVLGEEVFLPGEPAKVARAAFKAMLSARPKVTVTKRMTAEERAAFNAMPE